MKEIKENKKPVKRYSNQQDGRFVVYYKDALDLLKKLEVIQKNPLNYNLDNDFSAKTNNGILVEAINKGIDVIMNSDSNYNEIAHQKANKMVIESVSAVLAPMLNHIISKLNSLTLMQLETNLYLKALAKQIATKDNDTSYLKYTVDQILEWQNNYIDKEISVDLKEFFTNQNNDLVEKLIINPIIEDNFKNFKVEKEEIEMIKKKRKIQ